jgi:hypothetical protein
MDNLSMKKPENTGGKKALVQVILFVFLIIVGTFAINFVLDLLDLL